MELRSNIKMLNYARKYLLNDTDNMRPLPERRAEARPCARTGDAAYRPSSGSVLPFLLRIGVQGAV